MKFKILLGCLLVFFLSCQKNNVINQYKEFEEQKWHTDSIVRFNYFIEDSLSHHIIKLNIRHSTDYEFQNLFLFVYDDLNKDTIEVFLADKRGKWIGKGMGDVREVELTLYKAKKYFSQGQKHFMIEQAMRYGEKEEIMVLSNIIAVGLHVYKKDE